MREVLFWSNANLAMAHSAKSKNAMKYSTVNYVIRAKLYKGLIYGSMKVGSLYDDERVKLLSGACCSYCCSSEHPSLDHIFPRIHGGKDAADNLVFACRSCNSSKGKKDVLVWIGSKGVFPPLSILRRYLKLSMTFFDDAGIMEVNRDSWGDLLTPFVLSAIPLKYPCPSELIWSYDMAE